MADGLDCLPPEVVEQILARLDDRDDLGACRLASRLFCTRPAAHLAAHSYAGRPRRLIASSAPLEAVGEVFAWWRRPPTAETVKAAARVGRLDIARWAAESIASRFYTPRDRPDSDQETAAADDPRPDTHDDDAARGHLQPLDLGDVVTLMRAMRTALRRNNTEIAAYLLCESGLLAPGWCVSEVVILSDAAIRAPLSSVVTAVEAFRRRGWTRFAGAALGVAAFYAMEGRRTEVASWLHAQPEIRGRDGVCRCDRVAGERAFCARRVDWLRWLDAVGCDGRCRPREGTFALALRAGDAGLVRWAVEAARAADLKCSVDEYGLASAMRNGRHEALWVLDEMGIAPFASWGSVVAAVANPSVGVDVVRGIVERGGPCGADVLARATRAGRTDVLAYLFAEGKATPADAVAVALGVADTLSPERGWMWEAAAKGLAWLRANVPEVAAAVPP